jgi:uncharacterized protein RhaS with RHS repeats
LSEFLWRLTYNYFGDYDAQVGGYVESCPIGLRGGVNTYVYTKDKPFASIDPLGLLTTVFSGQNKKDIPDDVNLPDIPGCCLV